MGWPSLPSWNDVRRAATNTYNSGVNTARQAGQAVVNTGRAAVNTVKSYARPVLRQAGNLARNGADLGRQFARNPEATTRRLVSTATRNIQAADNAIQREVRSFAGTARKKLGEAEKATANGIWQATSWTSKKIGQGADAVRGQINGNDIVSRGLRGAVTSLETNARFTVGAAGGVTREVAGLATSVGSLAVTAAEYKLSSQARTELNGKIAGAAEKGIAHAANYSRSVAADPSRLVSDLKSTTAAVYKGTSDFVGGQIKRYDDAIKRGEGAETIGWDVGRVGSNFIPFGAAAKSAVTVGKVATTSLTGALTKAAAREGVEVTGKLATRELAEAGAKNVVRDMAQGGAREATQATANKAVSNTVGANLTDKSKELVEISRQSGREVASYYQSGREVIQQAPKSANHILEAGKAKQIPSALGDVPKIADTENAASQLENLANKGPKEYGVAFFGESNLKYYTAENATIGRQGNSFFMMPLEDSVLVKDAASAAKYTGMSPSTLKAYTEGGDIFGLSFPTKGMQKKIPTVEDAGGWPHFLEGGHTAVKLGDGPGAGYLVNPTREFVIPGGNAVPEGSVLFKLETNGIWAPIRKF